MGMKKTPILWLLILLILTGCNYKTADINLHGVQMSQAYAMPSSAWYLSKDGTLYCTFADSDASSFVVYKDQKNGIVAHDVIYFREMISGGCYINKTNDLYIWNRDTIPLYGYNQAKTHKCIANNVKAVVPYTKCLLFVDLNGNLYLLGEFEGEQYSVYNPKCLATGISCVSNSVSNQTTILWSGLNGDIGGFGIEDDGILEEWNSRFPNSTVSDIQIANDFIVVLSDDQLWFYGDYNALCSGADVETKQWILLDESITKVSCSWKTIGALNEQGQFKVWGRCLSNDASNTAFPEYEYYKEKVIAENTKNIYVSDGCIAYIDNYGASQIFHSNGYQSFYGNATTDECVGINRSPNTWVQE